MSNDYEMMVGNVVPAAEAPLPPLQIHRLGRVSEPSKYCDRLPIELCLQARFHPYGCISGGDGQSLMLQSVWFYSSPAGASVPTAAKEEDNADVLLCTAIITHAKP